MSEVAKLKDALEQAQYALMIAYERAADLGAQGLAQYLSEESEKAFDSLSAFDDAQTDTQGDDR